MKPIDLACPTCHIGPRMRCVTLTDGRITRFHKRRILRTEVPRCLQCLSYDVAVKVIDLCSFEHYLCAECDEAFQRLRDWLYAVAPASP
jgi:hypothetical protein